MKLDIYTATVTVSNKSFINKRILLQVAVKIMDVTQIREDYVIKNLYREAKILSKLKHPCIVSLFQTMQVIMNTFLFPI